MGNLIRCPPTLCSRPGLRRPGGETELFLTAGRASGAGIFWLRDRSHPMRPTGVSGVAEGRPPNCSILSPFSKVGAIRPFLFQAIRSWMR